MFVELGGTSILKYVIKASHRLSDLSGFPVIKDIRFLSLPHFQSRTFGIHLEPLNISKQV